MTKDTKLSELVINKLTKMQYDGIATKDPNQLYIVTDAAGFEESRTNCITHIPQDIKLELKNGTLTLKAGSKVYVPNGSGGFDSITIASDITVGSPYTNAPIFLYYYNGGIQQADANAQQSGSSYTITAGLWYDTTNNYVKRINSGAVSYSGVSFPIGIVSATSGSWSNIDQVFNGFGYIGGYGFLLPNVKFLIPNGRNADGTLKNIEFTTSTVQVRQVQYGGDSYRWWIQPNGSVQIYYIDELIVSETPPTREGRTEWYKPSENRHYLRSNSSSPWSVYSGANFAIATGVPNGNVTEFKPKTTFHAVDYNDKPEITSWSAPSDKKLDLTFGASGTSYTAPANGWFCIYGIASVGNGYVDVSGKLVTGGQNASASGSIWVSSQVKRGDTVKIVYANYTNQRFYFRYAEGEK